MQTVDKLKTAAPAPSPRELARERRASEDFLDEFGREKVDSRPMAPPVGFKAMPDMFEQVRAMMARVSAEAEQAGFETEEEANDFYIEGDEEVFPQSQHEVLDLSDEEVIAEAQRRGWLVKRPGSGSADSAVDALVDVKTAPQSGKRKPSKASAQRDEDNSEGDDPE